VRTVIAFDISSGRVRYRVVKALVEFAQRVQKSVFEAPELDRAAYLRLRSRLEGLIDSDTDAIRYYQLCESCAKRIEEHGCGPGTIPMTLPFEIL
jgi:CRISPR-associated protein Cas2